MTDIYEILRGEKDTNGNYQNQPVIVQGITGKYGSAHTKLMMEYGTNITAGVTPATIFVPYSNISLVCVEPYLPVIPCTITGCF